jgi:DNA-binding transcriptional LysR family regulator
MEDRLVKFAHVVEAGSFTQAAARLHISQPALTTAIKKLERELRTELLIRGSHSLTLTATGAIAYETASSLIIEGRNLQTKIKEASNVKTILNLGMIDSLANLLFVETPYLEQLEQGAQVSLTIDNSSRLIEQVSHNELDVALVAQPHRLQASLAAETVGQEPLVMVAPVMALRRVQNELAQGQLRHFLSYNQASRTHQIMTERFLAAGIALQPAFYSTSPELMLQLVLAGRGAAVLPYLLVKPHIISGALQTVAIGGSPVIRRTIISLRRARRVLTGQTALLLAHTQQELETLDHEASFL